MKSRIRSLALFVSAASMAVCANAATYQWDTNGATSGTGGTGTWDTVNTFWDLVGAGADDGTATPIAYTFTGVDIAQFGGTAGTVTLGAATTVNGLTFNTTGYTLTGSTLTLAGATPTITTGTGVSTTISSILTGSVGLVKNGAGTLALSAANTYTGGTIINSGTVIAGAGVAYNGADGGALGTGSITVNTGATLTSSAFFSMGGGQNTTRVVNLTGGTMDIKYVGTGGEYFKTINMTGGTILTSDGGSGGATSDYFRVANGGLMLTTLASAATSTVSTAFDMTMGDFTANVADGAAAVDLSITGNITQNTGAGSGSKNITKTGAGAMSYTGVASHAGTSTFSGGTTTISGTNGALSATSGVVISNGAVLTLSNTSAANNTNRINNAATVTMSGGTLNFTNDGSATAFSESLGTLTLTGGANTITTSQSGTTSVLTFAGVSRTGGSVNFTGAGLGTAVDARGEIRFTAAPSLTSGLLPWATVNGTHFATISGANNSIIAYSSVAGDQVTRFDGTKLIADGASKNIQIIEGSGGSNSAVTLGAATTTINTLNQSATGGTGAATINVSTNTLALNAILVGSGAGGLTIDSGTGGTLKSAGTSLLVIENSSVGSAINAVIADGTGASSFTKSGTGTLTLAGSNSYTGATEVGAGVLSVSVLANGGASSGIGASSNAAGNLLFAGGTLRYTGNTVSTDRNFTIAAGSTGTIDVATSGQILTISGSAAATTGALVKAGAGTLVLTGNNAATGGITVNAGTLKLQASAATWNTGIIRGAVTINNGGKLQIDTGNNTAPTDTININGGGILEYTAAYNAGGNNTTYLGTFNLDSSNGSAATVSGVGAPRLGFVSNALINSTGAVTNLWSAGMQMAIGSSYTTTVNTASGNTLQISGVISDLNGYAGTPFIKSGTGTLTLSGANSFSGNVSVNGGTVKIGNKNAFGSFTGGTAATKVTVASGAMVDFNGTPDATFGYTIAGTGVGGLGALTNSGGIIGGGSAQASNITLSADASIGGSGNWALLTSSHNATSLNLAGYTLTKTGSNTIWLSSTTTTAGTVRISSGTLTFGVGEGGSGVIGAASAFTLDNTLNAGLSVSRDSSVGSLSGGGASGGNVALPGTTLTVGALNTNTTYAGVISGTNGALTKTGTGALTLSGANTYTGQTTVSAGSLVVSGSLASGNALTVGASGTADFQNAGQTLGAVSNANTAANALNFSASTGTVTLASLTGGGNTHFGSNATVTGGIGSGTVTTVGALNANISGTAAVTAGGLLTGTLSGGTVGAGSLSSSSVTGGTNAITGAASITTLNGGTTTVGGVATIGTMTSGTANLNGATSAITTLNGGTVNLGTTTALTVNEGTFGGSISGGSLTKNGSGNLTLGSANSFNGLTVNAGKVTAGNANALGNGTVSIIGGELDLGGIAVANTTISVTGGTVSGASGYAGQLNFGGAAGLNGTFAGIVDLGLDKTRAYSTTGLTVASTGTLQGQGTVTGNVTVNGHLNIGNSPGTLEVAGDVVLGSSSRSTFEIGGETAGSFDVLSLSGTLTLDGTITVASYGSFNANTLTAGDSFDFIVGNIDGTGFNVATDLTFGTGMTLANGLQWDTSQFASQGILSVTTAIPEPSTYGLLGAGALALATAVRRRRRAAR